MVSKPKCPMCKEVKCPTCKKVLTGDEDSWCWTDTPYLAFCDVQCHDNYRHVVAVMSGGDYNNAESIAKALPVLHARQPITLLVHDYDRVEYSLFDGWARRLRIPIKVYAADYDQHGEAAWMLCGAEMLKENPDLVVAFAGRRTTFDTVRRCQQTLTPIVFV